MHVIILYCFLILFGGALGELPQQPIDPQVNSLLNKGVTELGPNLAIGKYYLDYANGMIDQAEKDDNLKVSEQCMQKLQTLANKFEENKMMIAKMVYNSGKDINDLGKFTACKDDESTRYILFSVLNLPVGIYLGMCVPVECTEDDFNSFRPAIAAAGNKILKDLDIDAAFFDKELTLDDFMFYDSAERNEEVQTLKAGHYVSIIILALLVVSLIVGTIFEVIEMNRIKALESLGVDPQDANQRRPT